MITKKTKHVQIREAIERFEQAIKGFDTDGSGAMLLVALKDNLALASDPHDYGCSQDSWTAAIQVLQVYRTLHQKALLKISPQVSVRFGGFSNLKLGAWGGLLAELKAIVDA